MKDAHGHGSDPRGTHSQGVQAVGKPPEMWDINRLHPTEDMGEIMITKPDGTQTFQLMPSDQATVDSMRKTIRSGGYMPPLIASRNGDLLDGHHRLEAYKAEGVKQVPVDPQPTPSYAGIRRDIERIHGKQS